MFGLDGFNTLMLGVEDCIEDTLPWLDNDEINYVIGYDTDIWIDGVYCNGWYFGYRTGPSLSYEYMHFASFGDAFKVFKTWREKITQASKLIKDLPCSRSNDT